jgi:hypothetical protein
MCTDPQTNSDGVTYACKSCDACIAVVRAEWISRGMMEKTFWKFTTVLCLTYSDDTLESRDGAAMFNYAHVSAFLKLVRIHLHRHAPGEKLRFLCAGEQGSRNGRCHWHLVIYSNVRLTDLGVCRRMLGRKLSETKDPKLLYTVGKHEIRVTWDNWPYGFVTFQEGDVGGLHYVLSYVLKERFSVQSAKGTARYTKSEPNATGRFNMSKRPAIGERFVWDKFNDWIARRVCPTKLDWEIPDMPGFYHPSGRFRRLILAGLHSMNKMHRWRTGADLPGWSTLCATYLHNLNTWGELNGTQAEITYHDADGYDHYPALGRGDYTAFIRNTGITANDGGGGGDGSAVDSILQDEIVLGCNAQEGTDCSPAGEGVPGYQPYHTYYKTVKGVAVAYRVYLNADDWEEFEEFELQARAYARRRREEQRQGGT